MPELAMIAGGNALVVQGLVRTEASWDLLAVAITRGTSRGFTSETSFLLSYLP